MRSALGEERQLGDQHDGRRRPDDAVGDDAALDVDAGEHDQGAREQDRNECPIKRKACKRGRCQGDDGGGEERRRHGTGSLLDAHGPGRDGVEDASVRRHSFSRSRARRSPARSRRTAP